MYQVLVWAGTSAVAQEYVQHDSDDVPSAVSVTWTGTDLLISSAILADVTIEVRIVHGEDDIVVSSGPYLLLAGDQIEVVPDWPDLSAKGAQLLLVPGQVTGIARVVDITGGELWPAEIPQRLVLLGSPVTIYPMEDLLALLPEVVEVSAGERIATVSPASFVR